VKSYNIIEDWAKRYIEIELKPVKDPVNDVPVVKFFSKPSLRVYVGYKKLKTVAWGRWIGIISTSKGLMPVHVAKKLKLWGELIAEIY
jgi:small subunit ribosomal protein S8